MIPIYQHVQAEKGIISETNPKASAVLEAPRGVTSRGLIPMCAKSSIPRICSVDGCDRSARTRGWCDMHYQRWLKYGDPLTLLRKINTCSIDGCDRPVKGHGWCDMHYHRWRNYGDPLAFRRKRNYCTIAGCNRHVTGHGYCNMHYQRWQRHDDPLKTIYVRFTGIPLGQRLLMQSSVDPDTGCWLWQGYLRPDGYARIEVQGKNMGVHRFSYEEFVGPIPDGLQIDHLCRNRACINPDHLEPVTHAENIRRGVAADFNRSKTHCPQGHPYSGENLYVSRDGRRYCRTCQRESDKRRRAKKKGGQSSPPTV